MAVEYILVDHWGVGRAVLIDDGHHESDEFWPEVQVLYGRTLLLPGNVLFPALREGNRDGNSQSETHFPFLSLVFFFLRGVNKSSRTGIFRLFFISVSSVV